MADSCKFYLQFGSQETREYCVRKGYLEIFEKAGAHVIEPSCGACINAGPGVSTRPDQIVISAQNRNFPGRSGPGQMYLASPLTVAASAVAGYIVEYEPASAARTGSRCVRCCLVHKCDTCRGDGKCPECFGSGVKFISMRTSLSAASAPAQASARDAREQAEPNEIERARVDSRRAAQILILSR